jgi:hypothetical protein
VYRRPILGTWPRVTGAQIPSDSFFADVVATSQGELEVFRSDSGWLVRGGRREGRSRYLDKALEHVLGGPLDHATVRALVEMLDRELTAERNRAGKRASTELRAPESV